MIFKSKITLLISLISLAAVAQKSTNWEAVDFVDEYKIKYKISGGASKLLQSKPTFINDYSISQATLMKGSSQAGTLQKQGTGSVFAEAALGGISKQEFQQMVDECYQQFKSELQAIGISITDGREVVQSKFAQKKKGNNRTLVGQAPDDPVFEKISALEGSDIKEVLHFRPTDKYIVNSWKNVSTLAFRLSSKEDVNTISINYQVRFANFEGIKKGLSENILETNAGLSVVPVIEINNPKGKKSQIFVNKRIQGGDNWANGMVKTAEKDGDWLGLSSSADYALAADNEAYIQALKSMLLAFQEDIIQGLQEEW